MTIIIYFHHSQYQNIKVYFMYLVGQRLRADYLKLVSYERLVLLMSFVLSP
jgi:hypothetical protein